VGFRDPSQPRWHDTRTTGACTAPATHVVFYSDDPYLGCTAHATDPLVTLDPITTITPLHPTERTTSIDPHGRTVVLANYTETDGTIHTIALWHDTRRGRWECETSNNRTPQTPHTPTPTTTQLDGHTMRACADCHSTDIAYDAYINVNDPTDVRTFDTIDCLACGGHDIDTMPAPPATTHDADTTSDTHINPGDLTPAELYEHTHPNGGPCNDYAPDSAAPDPTDRDICTTCHHHHLDHTP